MRRRRALRRTSTTLPSAGRRTALAAGARVCAPSGRTRPRRGRVRSGSIRARRHRKPLRRPRASAEAPVGYRSHGRWTRRPLHPVTRVAPRVRPQAACRDVRAGRSRVRTPPAAPAVPDPSPVRAQGHAASSPRAPQLCPQAVGSPGRSRADQRAAPVAGRPGTGSVPAQRRPARVPRHPENEEIPWRRATTATA